jgi:hypothetical protein
VSGYPVVDVVIGLSFVYFIVSVFASAIVEAIAGMTRYRARTLEGWLADNLTTEPRPSAAAKERAGAVLDHPLIWAMTKGSQRPSYVPAEQFVVALLEGGQDALHVGQAAAADMPKLKTAGHDAKTLIDALPESPLKDMLMRLWHEAGGDAVRFRKAAETWYDQAMDRLSGWYKRQTQIVLWSLGLIFALVLNVDTIRIADTLWHDQTLRQIIVAHAQSATSPATGGAQVNDVPLPIGWGGAAGGVPSGWDWVLKALGVVLTSAAVSLGAPFWFDSLSKLANLRDSGPAPAKR